ncbi:MULTISPECIES: MHYT domain-containing protein [Streptomyces]|uniref:MHYT domain-containing protein n=1 Tax=Streptomyces edwardsiae TaxID=3075527 RepID=A0ABU2QLG1_9ACTN|nr:MULTISPECIES: MHYT domain-containing protein [unclassified Streptomyces]MDT0404872.1 MHYT domain-containing protein [Streptomyces sp. DSM 41635]
MQGTVDGFNYGLVTPVAAYLVACLGGALGLRCTTRSLRTDGHSWKPGWLALGAASIGCGIWTMHFIAMLGFTVEETSIRYDLPLTLLSLAVAVVVVGIGVFIVGYRGVGTPTLLTAGTVTGLGVAGMHYIGMASMRMGGAFAYEPVLVVLSVVIAVAAATAALWAAVSVRGFLPSVGASLVMGVAVTGMHYTGMSAMSVHLHGTGGGSGGGTQMMSVVLSMLLGPLVFLLIATAVVMFDPLLISGDDGRPARPANPPASHRAGAAGTAAGPVPTPNRPVPPAHTGDSHSLYADPWAQGTGGNVSPHTPGDPGRGQDRPAAW